MFLLPAVDASCDALRGDLNAYLQGNLPTQIACARALVFYRRHSHHLETHLSDAKVDFYESSCDRLRDAFHIAGHCLRTPRAAYRDRFLDASCV